MASYRLGQAAELLGVSVDTVRRLADSGRLQTRRTAGGQRLIDGADLARLASAPRDQPPAEPILGQSARNRLRRHNAARGRSERLGHGAGCRLAELGI